MLDEAFKSAEIRVAAYNDLTAEQGRALYAAYVKRGLEIERLELQIKHPQGGFCSYCGHHFEYGSEVSEEYRAKVVEHMSICDKAPFQKIMQPLMLILDWMHANLPEMECRGDEDCDHCYGLQLLEPFEKALPAAESEKECKDGR